MDEREEINYAVLDFIKYIPPEKQETYEMMLRRCNFHNADDPGYPMMLFLLFFQESFTEKSENMEQSILALKKQIADIPQVAAAEKSRKGNLIGWILLALLAVNLFVSSVGIFRAAPVSDRIQTVQATKPESNQRELEAINLYWKQKIAEEETNFREQEKNDSQSRFLLLALSGMFGTALLSSLLAALLIRRHSPEPAYGRKGPFTPKSRRILNLFRFIGKPVSPTTPEPDKSAEKTALK